MDDAADFYDFRLKNTVCRRIGNHQCGKVVFVLFRLGTKVVHIHIALCVASASHGSETSLDGRCRICAVGGSRNQHFVAVSLTDVFQISADNT